MVRIFFWLALVITLIFFVQALIFAVLQWVIYFRVEQTTLNVKGKGKSNDRVCNDCDPDLNLEFAINVIYYIRWGCSLLA